MGPTHSNNITINTYDIETFTENEKVIPYCVCMILDNKNYTFYLNDNNADIIYESIKCVSLHSAKKELTFYIHNLNFDGIIILESLFNNNIFPEIVKRNLNLYKISFSYLDTIIILKCSYKLLPMSLNNLSLEIDKKKMPFPYKFSSRNNLFYVGLCPEQNYFNSLDDYLVLKDTIFDFKAYSILYCNHDVLLLKKVLSEIIYILKFTLNMRLDLIFLKSNSIPSFSQKVYYKYYNLGVDKKLSIDLYAYIKNSYFGGRTEIFGNPIELDVIHYFDFSGMYGLCMMENFPIGSCQYDFNVKKIDLPGFYYICFEQINDVPVLPYRMNNKLFFPEGNLEGIYWFEEIKLFLQNGGVITEIKYAIIYKEQSTVFKQFVNTFTTIRNEGGYKKVLGKLIINSLYGGFGLKEDDVFTKITNVEIEFYDILENLNVKSYTKINSFFIIEIFKDKKSQNIINKENKKWNAAFSERNIAYASIITSKARIKLYNAFNEVIKTGGRLLYSDTDSIYASFKKNNMDNHSIKWITIYDDACFILPKFYALKKKNLEEIKIKGIRNFNYSFDNIKKIFYQNDSNITIKNEMVFYKKNFELKQRYIDKNVWLNKYDKRIFINNKKSTIPIFIKSHSNNDK